MLKLAGLSWKFKGLNPNAGDYFSLPSQSDISSIIFRQKSALFDRELFKDWGGGANFYVFRLFSFHSSLLDRKTMCLKTIFKKSSSSERQKVVFGVYNSRTYECCPDDRIPGNFVSKKISSTENTVVLKVTQGCS